MVSYKGILTLGCLLLLNIFICNGAIAANLYVDNGVVEPGATWNQTNGSSYTCSHGTGTGYATIQAAVSAMSGGDDLYIRGGTYTEYVTLSATQNGTSEDWSSIQSYPGEWAVVDANDTYDFVIGKSDYDKIRSSRMLAFWLFERLEVTGGSVSGFFTSGGPFIYRYNYIHDNTDNVPDKNPCGIKGTIWKDSIVEFNHFKNNGNTTNGDHGSTALQIHSDYLYSDPEVGPTNIANAMQNNTYRYNLIEDTKGWAYNGIHQKARQYLTPHTTINWTYQAYGDKIHHNIITGVKRPIGIMQDFAQVYNNIAVSGGSGPDNQTGITVNDPGSNYGVGQTAVCLYNNSVINGRLTSNWGKGVYVKNPYIYWYNNIVDAPPADYSGTYDFQIGDPYMLTTYTYDSSRVHLENNYLYRSINDNQIKVTRNTGIGYGVMTLATYNSKYSVTNYAKATSEGTDNLYEGTGGADQYITRSAHVVSGAITIANGGKGGSHPFLSGVTIPSYIGAVNPDDNSWVAGVYSLANISNLQGGKSGDPSWIEGATPLDSTIPGLVPALILERDE